MREGLFLKNRKGSHIGVVISFMVFVFFVLFVRIIIEPALVTNTDKEVMLDSIEKKLIDETSFETLITTISISVSSSTCVRISSFVTDFDAFDGIVIKNENGGLISNSLSSTDSDSLNIERNSVSEDFVKIYSSRGFGDSDLESISCTSIVENSGYEIIMTKRENYVFEDRVLDLISNYEDYQEFVENLNLPNSTDMGFSFELANGTTISTNETEVTTNIFVQETPIKYLDRDANILSGKFKIRIW